MSTEEFNALPEEARRFIISHAGCLGCGGNKEQKLTKAYELYKTHKKMSTYHLHGGGINYVKDGVGGVLYPIHPEDSADQIREKIALAKEIHDTSPHVFAHFSKVGMAELLESLPAVEVINLDKPVRGKGGKFEKKEVVEADDEI